MQPSEPLSDLPTHAEIVVVGAGMAGLSAAVRLQRAGREVLVLESADAPGGRVRTDVVDGLRLDRGFQLLNPSYPQLRRLDRMGVLDLDGLRLRSFDAGVRVALDTGHAVLADPRRHPRDLAATVGAPLGSLAEKVAFAAWALRCALSSADRVRRVPDRSYGQSLTDARVSGALRRSVIEPFLAGVLGEDETQTSQRFVSLVMKAFLAGTPAVPALGMQALPDQLAASLRPGTLRIGVAAASVTASEVRTGHGRVTADAVIVATDPITASELLELDRPRVRSLTTVWFTTDQAPSTRPILHLDGLRRGPVVNAAVLTAAAPEYAPAGTALIACNAVGLHGSDEQVEAIRTHGGQVFGVDSRGWQTARVDVIPVSLPAMVPPLEIRQPVRLPSGIFVAGDHRDTASLQGALASGARAARGVQTALT